MPPSLNSISLPKSLALLKIYFAFSIERYLSWRWGVWIASVGIPSNWIPWFVIMDTILNIASWIWPLNIFPVINLVGGIYLSGALGNISLAIWAWANSNKNPFSIEGSISKAWPSPICSSGIPALIANCSFINWEANTVYAASTASSVVK